MHDEYISREAAVKAANEWVSEACMAPVMRVSRLLDKLQKCPLPTLRRWCGVRTANTPNGMSGQMEPQAITADTRKTPSPMVSTGIVYSNR